jgi:type III pantothenate kinase
MDIGNSRIKWRVVAPDRVVKRGVVDHFRSSWSDFASHDFDLQRVRVANVAGPELASKLDKYLQESIGVTAEFAVSERSIGKVVNGYTVPGKLGVDRWLAIVAGWNIVQGPCLVIDAGSALTVDFIGAEGAHSGGYIVPGLSMMQLALYGGTSDVRFDQLDSYAQFPGRNTAEAVQNGCFEMVLALLEQSYRRLVDEEGSGRLIFTGGWSEQLMNCLDEDASIVPELVLDGLAFALP